MTPRRAMTSLLLLCGALLSLGDRAEAAQQQALKSFRQLHKAFVKQTKQRGTHMEKWSQSLLDYHLPKIQKMAQVKTEIEGERTLITGTNTDGSTHSVSFTPDLGGVPYLRVDQKSAFMGRKKSTFVIPGEKHIMRTFTAGKAGLRFGFGFNEFIDEHLVMRENGESTGRRSADRAGGTSTHTVRFVITPHGNTSFKASTQTQEGEVPFAIKGD